MQLNKNRRRFIQTMGTIGAMVSLSPYTLFAATRQKKEKLGVALVGLGYYSTDVLAPALQETKSCYLAGIVTGTPAKIDVWKKKYNLPDSHIYNYQNFEQIANNPDIDVIYVVLPPSMHQEYVVRAARTGKHVWCEKPMAMSVAECEAMIKACKENKVSLSIGYRCQHDPNTQEFQRFSKEKTFGKIQSVVSSAGYFEGRTDHWKQKKVMGGGVMYDLGVYALQGARLAIGEEPAAVTAQFHTTRPEIYKEVEETALFQLEFPGGALANCTSSFGINVNFLHASCEKGTFKMEPFWQYSGNKGSSPKGIIAYPIASQQVKQMEDDAQAILAGKEMLVPGEEGLRDIKIVEAVYKAARTGKRIKL